MAGPSLGLAIVVFEGKKGVNNVKNMKNVLSALALATFTTGLAPAQSAPAPVSAVANDFAARASISWSAKNVFRGKERSSEEGLVQSAVTLEYNVPGFSGISLYAGFFDADSVERTYAAGIRKEFSPLTLDVGFQHLTSPATHTLSADGFSQLRADDEVYLGVVFQAPLRPSAYVYYSIDQQQVVAELALGKVISGLGMGVTGYDFEIKAYAGLADARKVDDLAGVHNSYNYAGASLDLTRTIGLGSRVGVGVNYVYNHDHQEATKGADTWLRVFAGFRF